MNKNKKIDRERLINLRKTKGLSLEELSKEIENIELSALIGYENGSLQPDYHDLLELAYFFNSSFEYLFGELDYRNPEEVMKSFYVEGKSAKEAFETVDNFDENGPKHYISFEDVQEYFSLLDIIKERCG